MDALNRCVEIPNRLGIIAVVVYPIDENANKLYSRYGFILLPSSGKMFIPVKSIRYFVLFSFS